jgi:NADH-quinone oxidoreductase subunit I
MTVEPPPAPRPALPSRSRGVIALIESNCTVCMICARECPDWCIQIEGHVENDPPTGPGRRPVQRTVLDRFAIDYGLCMYCGICVEVCPFDALAWAPDHDYVETEPAGLVHEKDRLGGWLPATRAGQPGAESPPPR